MSRTTFLILILAGLAAFWAPGSAADAARAPEDATAFQQPPSDDEDEKTEDEKAEEEKDEESKEEGGQEEDESKDEQAGEDQDGAKEDGQEKDEESKEPQEQDQQQAEDGAQPQDKQPAAPIDDGLTDEERDLLRRPMTELSREEQQQRREVVRKMQEHLRKNLKQPAGIAKPQAGADGAKPAGPDGVKPPGAAGAKPPRVRGQPRRQPDQPVGAPPPEETTAPPVEPAAPKRGAQNRPPAGGNGRAQTPAGADDKEPTLVELPDLPADADNLALPWNQRRYSFTIQGGNYRDLVDTFADQASLPLLNAAEQLTEEPQGQISYSSLENLDFYTALSEVNDLLYHQIRPPLYLFLRYDPETGSPRIELYAVREWRQQLPDSRVFMELERVKWAGLRGSDIVRVFFTPKNAAQMRVYSEQVANVLDDTTLTTLTGNGYIDFYGRLDQLNKMLDYMDKFETIFEWGKNLERIPLKHINPSDAVVSLKGLMEGVVEQAEGAATGGRNKRNQPNEEIIGDAAKIVVIPDDAHRSLLVQGLPYKVNELKEVLEDLDIPEREYDLPDPENMRVVKLKYSGADEAAELLDAVVNGSKVSVKRDKKGKPSVEVDTEAGLHITPDSRSQVLMLSGTKDVLDFAEQFLREHIDVPADKRSTFRRVNVQHVDPQELADVLSDIIGGGRRRPPKEGAAGGEFRAQVAGKSLILVGEPGDMESAENLVRELDVPPIEKATLFYVEMERAKPSKAVAILESQQVGQEGVAAVPPKEGPGRRGARAGGAQRFIPDDDSGILYFTGTQTEWDKDVLPVIRTVDQSAKAHSRSGQVIPVEYTAPEEIIAVLDSMFGQSGPKAKPEEAGLQFFPAPRGLMVVGDPTKGEMETIRQIVTALDVDPVIYLTPEITRFFPLKQADPTQVIGAIQTMFTGEFGPGAGPEPGMPGPKRQAARRLRGAQPSVGSSVRAVAADDGIIVFTVEANIPKIEQIIAMMDRPDGASTVVFKRFAVVHVDPYQIEEQLHPLLESRLATEFKDPAGQNPPRELLNVAGDPRTGSVLVSAPQSIVDYAQTVLAELDVPARVQAKVIDIYECRNATASELAAILSAMYGGSEAPMVMPPQGAGDKDRPGNRVRISPGLMRRGGGADAGHVEILALPGDKAVSIAAESRAEVDEIKARALEIDSRSVSDERITRLFTLRWADPEQVARDIVDLLDQRAPARPGAAEEDIYWEPTGPEIGKDITALPNAQTRTIIVVAPPAKMTAIEHLITTFEEMADPGNVEITAEQPFDSYTPKYLGAYECLDAANRYLDAVYGVSDRPVTLSYVDSHTLVIKGKRRYFDLVKEILTERIDTADMLERQDNILGISKIPSGVSREKLFNLLKGNLPGVDLEIENLEDIDQPTEEMLLQEVHAVVPDSDADRPERR